MNSWGTTSLSTTNQPGHRYKIIQTLAFKKVPFAALLVLILLATASSVQAGWITTQLTTNLVYDSYPQINNNGHVVWSGPGGTDGGTDSELFYYDGSIVTQLTVNSDNEGIQQINNNGHVVWQGTSWLNSLLS